MELFIFLLLFFGTLLCVVEFFMPGFGVFGIGGAIFLVLSTVLSYMNFQIELYIIIIVQIALIFILSLIFYHVLKKVDYFNRIILRENSKQDEFVIDESVVGKEGIAKTPLKPVGIITIDNVDLEVSSMDGYILSNEKVIVKKIENKKIIVGKY